MTTHTLKQNTKELRDFIKKANQKLLEIEVIQSVVEIRQGKYKVYNSPKEAMRAITSRL